jgi:5'-3' exoribonuclease 2
LAGSNRDVVANRRAIRMANMSAAEVLKAEMSGLIPVKPDRSLPVKPPPAVSVPVLAPATLEASPMSASPPIRNFVIEPDDTDDVPGFGNHRNSVILPAADVDMKVSPGVPDDVADGEPDSDALQSNAEAKQMPAHKRKFEEGPGIADADGEVIVDEDDDAAADGPLALKVNADGTVDQVDTVQSVLHLILLSRARANARTTQVVGTGV